MISVNEVALSDEYEQSYALYRVFEFARSPRLFVLEGQIASHLKLAPATYRANFQVEFYYGAVYLYSSLNIEIN